MVNYKQMIGLIILSLGIVLMIYALKTNQFGTISGTLIAGIALVVGGIVIGLSMNKQK